MIRIEFMLKSSLIQKKILFSSATSLVLTFLDQINKINYISSIYVIASVLLGKIEHLKYALSILATGCILDLFYLIFHSSDSSWAYVRCIQFIVHLLAFIFEIVWIIGVYCYLKQEQSIKDQNKTNWFGKQIGKFLPGKFGMVSGSDQPSSSNEPQSDATTLAKTPKEKPSTPAEALPEPAQGSPPEENSPIGRQVVDEPSKTDEKPKQDK